MTSPADVDLDLEPDYVPVPVAGKCPMCGGRLELDVSSRIRCTSTLCTDAYAAHRILDEPDLNHVVRIEGDRFHLMHPLHERINDRLLTCSYHAELAANEAEDLPSGEYTVTHDELGDLAFEARS